MKNGIFYLLGLCLILASCNAPKSPEEVKEAAIEVVQNFIEDIYNDDLDVDDYCSWCCFLHDCESLANIDEEFSIPIKISVAARENGIKLDPAKVSFNKDVKEIRIDREGYRKYFRVEIKHEGHKYGFMVYFSPGGKTGTEGKAKIYTTIGLVPFNNAKYAKKTGFTLDCQDNRFGDMTPYAHFAYAVESSRIVQNEKNVKPLHVTIKGRRSYEVFCSDSIVYTVIDRHIIKATKKLWNNKK